MKLKFLFKLLLISIISSVETFAFVHQKTVDGESFTWGGSSTDNVNIYVNGDNSSGIPNNDIISHALQSASEWNQTGGPNILVRSWSTGPRDAQNDVYFTNDSSMFSGSSVLAVTQSIYNSSTGRIIESDILIKDSVLFSGNKYDELFIGDLISHEMGHLIGLDHSSMPFSTMFYKLIRGQQTISFDDFIGKKSLYDQRSYQGKIQGKVAGGSDITSVFGADVKLISSTSGQVIASTLSDEDGSYSFEGIPLNDVYYIYISPFKALDTVSQYYQTVKTDFCSSFNDFRGAFYQGCGNSRKGYPIGIHLTSERPQVDTGIISIKCGLDTPLGYMSERGVGSFELDGSEDKSGDSFVGFFSHSDVQDQRNDEILIDLSEFDSSDGNYYLDLRVLSQEFYSKVAYEMEVSVGAQTYNYSYSVTSDNTPNLNLNGRILLDSSNPYNNVFTIKITPQDFDEFKDTTSFVSESLFFPSFQTFGDDKFFYQFIYYISKEQPNGEIELHDHYDYPLDGGNKRCMDGLETYSVKSAGSVTGITNSSSRSNQEKGALACGSVAFVDGGGNPPNSNGPMTVMVGFLLTLLLGFAQGDKSQGRKG